MSTVWDVWLMQRGLTALGLPGLVSRGIRSLNGIENVKWG